MQVYDTHSSFDAEKLQQHEAGLILSFKVFFFTITIRYVRKKNHHRSLVSSLPSCF